MICDVPAVLVDARGRKVGDLVTQQPLSRAQPHSETDFRVPFRAAESGSRRAVGELQRVFPCSRVRGLESRVVREMRDHTADFDATTQYV